ncbi:MAG: hypothetical protein ACRC9L_01325 [Brevinema sp.]
MNYTLFFINNAEERFETLRPTYFESLKSVVEGLSRWESNAFFAALDGLQWKEKRMPLSVFNSARLDWEKQYSSLPYVKPSYQFLSYKWKQEVLSFFLPKKARYTLAFKKGIGLIDAVGNLNEALRAIYTDFPVLYKMDKIGVGVLLVTTADLCHLQEKLAQNQPKTELPILIIAISH